MRYSERVRQARNAWLDAGRDPALLLTGFDAALAGIWGRRHQLAWRSKAMAEIMEYIRASERKTDRGAIWRAQKTCPQCRQIVRMELIYTCVECGAQRCADCVPIGRSCPACGGEMY